MILFSAIYNFGATDIAHRAFTLCVLPAMPVLTLRRVLPRWDCIAILFSVFLLTVRPIVAEPD